MVMTAFQITPDPLESADVLDLLRLHLNEMHAASPACKVHAMPPERLRENDVTFYAVRMDGDLAAVGALKDLGGGLGELKSMRASPAFRGQGAGRALLEHLIGEAQARGYKWLGLETGRTSEFEAARRLYERYGFAECDAFNGYTSDDFSMCMERAL
ncbi:MAG: GNAT family N-acetyltransferase [Pseudomonadota bacterium]